MDGERRAAGRREALEVRARVLRAIRGFFHRRDYLEVETPNRIPAPLPESHIDALPSGDWFLHPSPELCMKRLLAAGHRRIFQVGKVYRGGERGSLHLPEFTLLEWYRAGTDYRGLMEECEDLFLAAAEALGLGRTIRFGGREIDLSKPWRRLSVEEAFQRHGSLTLEQALAQGRFEEVLSFEIEPAFAEGKPLFLHDYPLAFGSLARRRKDDPRFVERFEIYIGGLELANGFSELTDAEEQRRRFERENEIRRARGRLPYPMPVKFLEALETMPESAGVALGVDRMVMLFSDTPSIDGVVAFTPEEL